MGEAAEDIYLGHCCQDCNTYFVREHGYPVLCRDCYKDYKREHHRKPLTARATELTLGEASVAEIEESGWTETIENSSDAAEEKP